MFPCVYASCRPATCFEQDQSAGTLRVTQVDKMMRFSRSKNTFIGSIGSRQFKALTVKCPGGKFKYIVNPKNNVLQTSNTCVYCVFKTTFFQTFSIIYIYMYYVFNFHRNAPDVKSKSTSPTKLGNNSLRKKGSNSFNSASTRASKPIGTSKTTKQPRCGGGTSAGSKCTNMKPRQSGRSKSLKVFNFKNSLNYVTAI
jgi:hypothetical protein